MKKGMELPVNFLVMLVLGMVMFGTAIYIAYKVFSNAEELQEVVDKQTKTKIESMLKNSNQKVVLGIGTKTIKRGEKDTFWVGIRNEFTEDKDFYIKADCSAAFSDKIEICNEERENQQCAAVCDTWAQTIGSKKIQPKEVGYLSVHVMVPKDAQNGNYNFKVLICADSPCVTKSTYDNAKMIIVNVA
ncbi:MAG: hypothetical protein QXK37_06420 [Candidatus Woesearchaeota archaeon]